MTNGERMSKWEQAVEYGKHIYGVLPDNTVTGVLSYEDDYFKSYMKGPEHHKYPRWEREYNHTPLGNALEAFVENGPMAKPSTKECYYNGRRYEAYQLGGGLLDGWRYEHNRKQHFRRSILRGEITLPAPSVFNRYGSIWTVNGFGEEIDDLYWDFVDTHYKHRHSHHTATSTQSD